MIPLALGFMGSSSNPDWFVLQGGGIVSCGWNMRSDSEAKVTETANVSVRGSLLELQAITARLEVLRASATSRQGFSLRVWSESRECYLYSPISVFNWQIMPGHAASTDGGSFRIELKWERDNLFYGEEVSLPLSNSSGVAVTNGLTLLNHDDQTPGHDNWFEANLIPIGNQWKLPLRIELKNTSSGEPLADFWLGSMALPASGSFPNLVFEAENGTGGTVLTDAGASNGKYCRYDWTNSGWTDLASWTISAVDCTRLQGFNLLPFLRFFSAPTEANLKLRWKLMVESVPVWLGPQSEMELGRTSLRMEPFAVPWGNLPLRGFAAGHQLILQAFHVASGAHQLSLDDFLLLPQQSFAAYHAISALKQNASLTDDQLQPSVWSSSGGLELRTHLRVGTGHYLQPGTLQRFYCFQREANGAAPIARALSVKAWYRPAWRLP